ncbi:MAG: PqqD family protein [Candidatus Omnitrophota bacterium]
MDFSEHVKIREERFGAAVFETLKEKVFVTNDVGKEILALIKKGYSRDDIVAVLKDGYCGDVAEIEKDVDAFITHLESNRIVVS